MTIIAKHTLQGLDQCPQCGIAHPNLSYKAHIPYKNPTSTEIMFWVIYQCSACYDVVCAFIKTSGSSMANGAANHLATNTILARRIIPSLRFVSNELPDRPRSYIEQAIASLHAPDGATMLAGSAVDAMLKLKGYDDGSVYARIEKAVADGVLTADMSEWAHAVRLEANKPRHADIDEPHATKEMAEQTIKFVEALGEYLFVLPARIERGKVAANEAATADDQASA